MVGDPKHLSDLDRIEADVRITCRECRFEDDWTTSELASHLRAIGGSTVWSEITRHMVCRRFGCGSPDLRAAAVPYARRGANMKARVSKLDAETVQIALAALREALSQQRKGAVATREVRLALLVLLRYTGQREAARQFWERASLTRPLTTDSLRQPLALIEHALLQRGWIAAEVRLDRPRVWPWNSPAPPGWIASPSCPRLETGSE
jgi:hypothetical protein